MQYAFERLRLSPVQQRLWLLMNDGSLLYLKCRLKITGNFDNDKWDEAIQKVIQQHGMLHTGFQTVQPNIFPEMQPVEDPENNPLFKCELQRLNDKEHTCTISVSVLVCDNHSLSLIINDIVKAYTFTEQVATENVPYSQYAEWQQNLLNFPESEALEFWSNYHRDGNNNFLPLAHQDVESSVYVPFRNDLILNNDENVLVKAVAGKLNTTCEAIYQACLSILLFRHSGNNNVVIGKVYNKREYEDLRNTVGAFAKTLPLHLSVTEEDSLSDVIRKIAERENDLEMWQDYFFMEPSNVSSFKKAELVFSVGYDYYEWKQKYVLAEKTILFVEDIFSNNDQFMLRLTCQAFEDQTKLVFSFDDKAYSSVGAEMLIKQYKALLLNLVRTPFEKNQNLAATDEEIIDSLQKHFFVKNYNFNNALQVLDLFEQQVLKNSEHTAIIETGIKLTYRELSERSNQLAHFLLKQKQEKNILIALLAERSSKAVISMLAILKSGCAFLPIDVDYPAERIKIILENSDAGFVITESRFSHLAETKNHVQILEMDNEKVFAQLAGYSSKAPEITVKPDDLAYVIYTSGSTGIPKGCEINHSNLFNYISWANDFYYGDEKGGSFPLYTSLGFDLTITSIFVPLVRGKVIYIYPHQQQIDEVLPDLFKNKYIDSVKLTPAHIRILAHLNIRATGIKKIIAGGEALTKMHLEILAAIDPDIEVFNEYGPTESTVGCIAKKVSVDDAQIYIGKPIANTEIYVMSNDQICAPGMTGELYICGAGLSTGYRNDIEKTNSRFKAMPALKGKIAYATGDLGVHLLNGEFNFLGRKDEQVKIMSYRVELGEIASVLASHPSVQQAVVSTKEDAEGQKIILGYVVSALPVNDTEIKIFMARFLPSYMIPFQILRIPEIPLTSNGKTDHKKLPAPSLNTIGADHIAPRSITEMELATIWSEILEIENVSINDHFFELGGTSLKAIRLISSVVKKMNVRLELKKIFAQPKLKDMAAMIENIDRVEYKPIPQLPESEYYELSHSQKRLWVLSQLEEGAVFYNMPRSYVLTGNLDIQALEKAFAALVNRHESIRTILTTINGEIRQQIVPSEKVNFKLTVADLMSDPDKENAARSLADKDAVIPFDFSEGMLLRASVLKMEKERSVLLVTIHHIVSDGWSMDIIIKEVLTLYNAFRKDLPDPFSPLPVQYKDYAGWHNRLLEDESFADHRNYWQKRLSGITELQLPADHERPKIKTYIGGSVHDALDEQTTLLLKKISSQCGTTMFVTVISVLKLFLNKITYQSDVIIGTPVTGRDHQDVESMVGFFVNMLASRTIINETATFEEFVKQVHTETMEDLEHQIYPFDMLVEDLKIKRDISRSAIYSVGFNWDMDEKKTFPDIGLEIDVFNADFGKAQADLWFFVREEENKIQLSIEYNSDLFRQSSVLVLMKKFKYLFAHCLTDITSVAGDINLLLPEEKELDRSVLKIDLGMFTS